MSAGAEGLDGEAERYVPADQGAARLVAELVGQAEVMPADSSLGQERHLSVAEVVSCRAGEFSQELDRAGDVLDGEVALQAPPVPRVFGEKGAGEGDGWVGVGVEVAGGAQVVVTLGDVGVDTCRCDGHRRRRLSEVFGDGDLPGELGEP